MAIQKSFLNVETILSLIISSMITLGGFACSGDDDMSNDAMSDDSDNENTNMVFNTPEKPLNDFSDQDAQSLCNSLLGLFNDETMSLIQCHLRAIDEVEIDESLDCNEQADICLQTWQPAPNTCSETVAAGFAVCPDPEVTAQDYITCLEDQSAWLDSIAADASCDSVSVVNESGSVESCQTLAENCPELFR